MLHVRSRAHFHVSRFLPKVGTLTESLRVTPLLAQSSHSSLIPKQTNDTFEILLETMQSRKEMKS